MDGRKKQNPRHELLSFRTDKKTAQTLKDEAKKKGQSMSQFLSNKLKP